MLVVHFRAGGQSRLAQRIITTETMYRGTGQCVLNFSHVCQVVRKSGTIEDMPSTIRPPKMVAVPI